MKKTLSLCITIFLCFFLSETKAQTDTTKYDLGRLQIKKSLTQAITIKAADLEKLPFSNLSDAVNVWLYGVYGSAVSYVPVIDGIIMTDVNALSIYDIEEITLVQNAAATLNGASPQQMLLLIKTRRKRPGKSGIEMSGQTNIVKLNHTPVYTNSDSKVENTSQFYNQYYLSGYINTNKVHAGLSADYQRDAMPATRIQSAYSSTFGYASTINRFKFNGYLDANLGKSVLSISTGLVPQRGDGSNAITTGSSVSSLINKTKDNLYYSNISLKSSFSGFQNTITGGYEKYTNTVDQNTNTTPTGPYNPGSMLKNGNMNAASNYLIKDNLSYTFKTSDWEISPSINLMHRYYKDTTYQSSQSNSGSSFQSSVTTTTGTQKVSLLTPTLNINYRSGIALQGGFEVMLSNPLRSTPYKPKKTYPFASVMLNIMELSGNGNSSTGLSIFGSYANTYSYTTDTYNLLSDVNYVYPFPSFSSFGNIMHDDPYKGFDQWQTGATLSLLNNKLIFNYTYSAGLFNSINTYTIYIPNYGNSYYYYTLACKLAAHRFGLAVNWLKSDKLSLQTNLNTSYIETRYTYPDNFLLSNLSGQTVKSHIVTGGLINRLNYKKAFFGADILYVFHKTAPYPASQYYHAFNLQNLYAGFKLNINGLKNLEIYANARSIAEDRSPTLLDTREYYSAGFKLGIQ